MKKKFSTQLKVLRLNSKKLQPIFPKSAETASNFKFLP